MPRKARNLPLIFLICVGAVVAAAGIYGAWWWLGCYIAPETATDRKDHVQVMAVGLGAVGAIITAIIGWRNLKQSQRSTERTLENTRAVEEERAQNDALQNYLEQMGQLLTKEELRSSVEGSDVRVLARSQTLTVLQGLGPNRKRILLRFLYESHLIDNENAIVSLGGADLREADLSGAHLGGTDLSKADLSGANLRYADLTEADLRGAELGGGDLRGADLRGADLRGARLRGADLREARLGGGDLREADLREANLSGANLTQANLSGAYPLRANLRDANLSGSTLRDVNLSDANLRDAKKVTNEELEEQARSLEGATMPDGSKHD